MVVRVGFGPTEQAELEGNGPEFIASAALNWHVQAAPCALARNPDRLGIGEHALQSTAFEEVSG